MYIVLILATILLIIHGIYFRHQKRWFQSGAVLWLLAIFISFQNCSSRNEVFLDLESGLVPDALDCNSFSDGCVPHACLEDPDLPQCSTLGATCIEQGQIAPTSNPNAVNYVPPCNQSDIICSINLMVMPPQYCTRF